MAPDLNAPGQRGEEEISPVKARAQKKNGRARGVESGARSRREEHARRGGQVLRAANGLCLLAPNPGVGACARARAGAELQTLLRQADPPEILLRSRRDLQENGFWASGRAWVEGLNFFFPAWTCTFSGVPVGGERYAARAGLLQPRPGVHQPPTSGINGAYLCPACARQVGRALHAPTLSSWRPKVAQTYDVKRYALSGGPSSSLPVQRKPHHAPYKRFLCMPRVRQGAWNGNACPGAHQAGVPKQREKCDVKRYP